MLNDKTNNRKNRRGQVAMFVIIAIVIVVGIVTFVLVRNGMLSGGGNTGEFKEIYDYYDQCIKDNTLRALDIAGSQGGRINEGEYAPGSEYMPFSSQMNFLGFPVDYWYYVSGNGVVKENIPLKSDVQREIGNYVQANLRDCDFTAFAERGYIVSLKVNNVDITLNDANVKVDVDADLVVEKDDKSAKVETRSLEVVSNYGKMYSTALDLYRKQINEGFLENYAVDILRLNAPVDGVEIQCNPIIWKTREVVDGLQDALEGNINSLKFGTKKGGDYFMVDYNSDFEINTIYSKNWPWRIEVYGADGDLMVATPVGNQEGLGIIGFCYVPYHYVYDLAYPVMFQIKSGDELFQFPVAVVIDKNIPRIAPESDVFDEQNTVDVCQFKNQDVTIRTFDNNLDPVDSDLIYECFNQRCDLGKTTNGVFAGKVPMCVNGRIVAKAEGYQDKGEVFSSNEEITRDLIMNKLYKVKVNVLINGKASDGMSVVTFTGERTAYASIPGNQEVELFEGMNNLTVYVYGNSSLKLPESKKQQCAEVPKSGIAGILGATEEKCVDITLPAMNIDYALIGGGKGEEYLLASTLESGQITINVDALPKPNSLEQLQQNYASFETMKAGVAL